MYKNLTCYTFSLIVEHFLKDRASNVPTSLSIFRFKKAKGHKQDSSLSETLKNDLELNEKSAYILASNTRHYF